MRRCPTCRGPLRGVRCHGRIVRRAQLDESTKRLINFAQDQYRIPQDKAFGVENELNSMAQRPINGVVSLQGSPKDQSKQQAKLSLWAKEDSKVST